MESAINERINQHENKLVKIETILERVAENQDRMAHSMEIIGASMSKQELILEKLANLEGNTKGSIDRIHKRIDVLETNFTDELKEVSSKVSILDPIAIMVRYPIIATLVLAGLYLFSIREFRDLFIK